MLFVVFSFFIFWGNINNIKAAVPPAGCTCPGPGGTCVGGGSSWLSPTQYQGYYYCDFGAFPCPGTIPGWNQISTSNELNDTHGCDSPACAGGGCKVGRILWEQIPAPSCTLLSSPELFIEGQPTDITVTWTTTNAASATLNGVAIPVASLASGSQVFDDILVATTYTLDLTGLNGSILSCAKNVDVIVPSAGGLVPCGRLANNPDTLWDEKEPCRLCHVIPLMQNIINYAIAIAGIISILMIALTMIASNTAIADAGQITTLKINLNKIIQGFLIILVAWVIVNLLMTVFGFIDPVGDGSWKKFNCVF